MELSSRGSTSSGQSDSFRNLEHRLRMIRSQQLDYLEHGMDAPPELERLAKRALVLGDEMTTGLPVDSPEHTAGTASPSPAPLATSAWNAYAGSSSSTAASCASPCSTRSSRSSWPASSSRANPSPTPVTCAGCRSSCCAAALPQARVDRGRQPRRPDRTHRRHLPPPGLPRPALPDGGPRTLRPRPSSSPSPAVASPPCSARSATWPRAAAYR